VPTSIDDHQVTPQTERLEHLQNPPVRIWVPVLVGRSFSTKYPTHTGVGVIGAVICQFPPDPITLRILVHNSTVNYRMDKASQMQNFALTTPSPIPLNNNNLSLGLSNSMQQSQYSQHQLPSESLQSHRGIQQMGLLQQQQQLFEHQQLLIQQNLLLQQQQQQQQQHPQHSQHPQQQHPQ
jgi:hypothetical protein